MNKNTAYIVAGFIGFLVLSFYGAKNMIRGFRNNNPGNIKWNAANNWHGQVGKDKDGFVIFDKTENGIDAIGELFDTYRRNGTVTLAQIINRFAPPDDSNDTSAYLSHVMQITGWPANYRPVREEGDYPALVGAIIKHENGVNPFPIAFVSESLERVT